MKQLENIDQKTIFFILKFYEDIGIYLQLNKHQKVEKKTSENAFIKNKDTVNDFVNSTNNICELENLFKNYNGCNLKKTATNFVKFQGSTNSEILFIDGTPNTEEDKVGKSFISSKGDLFDKMLNSIHLNKKDIFIANAIPWRPPGNRYPTEEEIKNCRPFILNLIKILSPKIIVCLGEVSTNQILNLNKSILKIRGKWYSLKPDLVNKFDPEYKPYILPTLNISYLLNRPDKKRQAWEDMKLLRDKIREI